MVLPTLFEWKWEKIIRLQTVFIQFFFYKSSFNYFYTNIIQVNIISRSANIKHKKLFVVHISKQNKRRITNGCWCRAGSLSYTPELCMLNMKNQLWLILNFSDIIKNYHLSTRQPDVFNFSLRKKELDMFGNYFKNKLWLARESNPRAHDLRSCCYL